MPIDDIDYLYKNSVKENIIIFVDSSKRDRLLYPTPSEFQIDFTEPFNFVYGIEVLDTTVPRTMFMIEYYNNLFVSKFGFDMLNHTHMMESSLMIQDFASAKTFFQRMNDQLGDIFDIDNSDNEIDYTDKFSKRLVSDYPVVRVVSRKYPFIIDMKASTSDNVLGFDQFALDSETIKYNNLNKVLNSFHHTNTHFYNASDAMKALNDSNTATNTIVPVIDTSTVSGAAAQAILEANAQRLSDETYKAYTHSKILESTNSLVSSDYGTHTFKYTHKPLYNQGCFIQNIEIISNKNFRYRPEQTFLNIVVKNITTNRTLIDYNYVYETNNQKTTLSLKTFVVASVVEKFGDSNTHLILIPNQIYEITVSKVLHYENDINITLQIGYSYFMNLQNLNIHDKVYVSKVIYDEINLITGLSNIVEKTQRYQDGSFYTECNKNKSLSFILPTNEDMSNVGSITYFEIEVKRNNLLNQNDIFVLRIQRENHNLLTATNNEITTTHLANIYLTYEEFSNEDNVPRARLYFKNDDIENSVFSFINLYVGVIDNEHALLNVHRCTLFSIQPVEVRGQSLQYNMYYKYHVLNSFGVISPGLLNLASENYIIVRCEEIENHLRGSHDIKEFSPGLGVLNIDVQGYASGRTEFYSVKYKEFHPIGKLSKMKFRFERKYDGNLYDFKNVDLHFMMSVKFLRPTQKESFQKSVLNPNYNPNYLGYFNKTMQDLYDDETTDESDIDDEYFDMKFNDRENILEHQFQRRYIEE